jgi:hypothetical protein
MTYAKNLSNSNGTRVETDAQRSDRALPCDLRRVAQGKVVSGVERRSDVEIFLNEFSPRPLSLTIH